MKPWTRQLDLCDGWLEIIIEEIKLRGHELSPTEINALSIDAARIRDRADALIKSLQRRPNWKKTQAVGTGLFRAKAWDIAPSSEGTTKKREDRPTFNAGLTPLVAGGSKRCEAAKQTLTWILARRVGVAAGHLLDLGEN
jgi:hypothetical protein